MVLDPQSPSETQIPYKYNGFGPPGPFPNPETLQIQWFWNPRALRKPRNLINIMVLDPQIPSETQKPYKYNGFGSPEPFPIPETLQIQLF